VEQAIGSYYKTAKGTRIQGIGVAEDGKYENLTEDPRPVIFSPILQSPSSRTWLVVRWNRNQQQLTAALNQSIRSLDPGLPFAAAPGTMNWTASFSRAGATVSSGFGRIGRHVGDHGNFRDGHRGQTAVEFGIRVAL
jgi:hypothetical protein